MKIGDKVKLLETYIVCHDTFISKGTVGTITDIVTFNKDGTKTDVAWIDVGLKNNSNQTIFAKEITNNLKLVQERG
jgi:hypothetical protein